jgi:hypothetical protein
MHAVWTATLLPGMTAAANHSPSVRLWTVNSTSTDRTVKTHYIPIRRGSPAGAPADAPAPS